MMWILVLAGTMAIFGAMGYLRGTKAATVTLLSALLGLLVIGPLGDTVVKYINAFAKGIKFITSGGMAALTGSGSADAAFQALQSAPPAVSPSDQALVLGLLYVIIVLLGILLSGIPWFRGPRSLWGMFLGLIAGYLVGGVIVRALWPQYAAFVPLPFVPEPAVVAVSPTSGTGIGPQIVAGLTALANSAFLPIIIAVAIVVFILLATRSSNKSARG